MKKAKRKSTVIAILAVMLALAAGLVYAMPCTVEGQITIDSNPAEPFTPVVCKNLVTNFEQEVRTSDEFPPYPAFGNYYKCDFDCKEISDKDGDMISVSVSGSETEVKMRKSLQILDISISGSRLRSEEKDEFPEALLEEREARAALGLEDSNSAVVLFDSNVIPIRKIVIDVAGTPITGNIVVNAVNVKNGDPSVYDNLGIDYGPIKDSDVAGMRMWIAVSKAWLDYFKCNPNEMFMKDKPSGNLIRLDRDSEDELSVYFVSEPISYLIKEFSIEYFPGGDSIGPAVQEEGPGHIVPVPKARSPTVLYSESEYGGLNVYYLLSIILLLILGAYLLVKIITEDGKK